MRILPDPFLAVASSFVLISCATSPTEEREVEIGQAELDKIADECGAPRSWLSVGSPAVNFNPEPGESFESASCVLNGLKRAGVTKIGFIGNDKLPEQEGQ